ncbi:hypothetical protein KIW84_065505 [Lathyrus oleraceus]|uniref:Uncharacterized protein n=1 Tax=Pisum sativum TaxID=3888 RepID=A0A9D5AAG9_PEA|nr:hypothetical protein KIW84_065505 [Pisum sativum]
MTTNTSNNILRSILEKEKLSGTNFLDWYRNMRIVLKDDKGKGKEVAKPKPTIAALKPSGGIAKEGTSVYGIEIGGPEVLRRRKMRVILHSVRVSAGTAFCLAIEMAGRGRDDAAIAEALGMLAGVLGGNPNVVGLGATRQLSEFQKNNPPMFKGAYDPDGAQKWLKEIERIF